MSGGAGALILAGLAACQPAPAPGVDVFPWPSDRAGHGGFSGIEVQDGGAEATLLLDTGWVQKVEIDRDPSGRLRALRKGRGHKLRPPPGFGGKFDTEGLALDGRRGFYVSTEDPARILRFDRPGAAPGSLPALPRGIDIAGNRGLEALARAADGSLWTLPERVDGDTLGLLVLRGERWSEGPRLAAGGGFVPVGLDFDDAGRLYLLERQFDLPFRFRSRVRRFAFANGAVAAEEVLLSSRSGQYDNLEGISVWRAGSGGLRVTLVSDDNFLPLQRTELVEFGAPG